ncbi:hypothetical protein MRX96_000426 [Rhipicephalus microplus]
MAEDCSPQRGPSGQSECSESSLTEPEVTDEEMIEDENAVEQQECEDRRGCDLSKDSPAPTKRPRPDGTLRSTSRPVTGTNWNKFEALVDGAKNTVKYNLLYVDCDHCKIMKCPTREYADHLRLVFRDSVVVSEHAE